MNRKQKKLRLESLESRQMMATLNPGISIRDVTVNEEAGYADVRVDLSDTGYLDVKIPYSTADGTANAGGDYQATNGTLTIRRGQRSGTIRVPIINDAVAEATEQFFIELGRPNWGRVNDGQAVATILDTDSGTPPTPDPDPTPTPDPPTPPSGPAPVRTPDMSIADVSGPEGSSLQFKVTLSAPGTREIRVDYQTRTSSARTSDFTATNGRLTFAPGETEKIITVQTTDDSRVESNEQFAVRLSGVRNARLVRSTAMGTIIDNDSSNPTPDPDPTPEPPPAPTIHLTIDTPVAGQTVSGTINLSGTIGTQWVNVAAWSSSGLKLSQDVTPVNGTYTLAVDTTELPEGDQAIEVIAFSVPAGQPGGIRTTATVAVQVDNVVTPPPNPDPEPNPNPPPVPDGPTNTGPFTVNMGQIRIVPNPGVPGYPNTPDGHVTMLPNGDGNFQLYWPTSPTYRTVGPDLFNQSNPTFAIGGGPDGSIDNGGSWLMSVHRIGNTNQLIGFYHSEDNEFGGRDGGSGGDGVPIAWKTSGYATSTDNGVTWTKHGVFLTSPTSKPNSPRWGGAGDLSVIWDQANQRWVAFYAEHFLYMAISTDPLGRPGTWYKLYNGQFSQPGIGGQATPISVLRDYPGLNPSVTYNHYLQRYVMVWGTHDAPEQTSAPNSIWLSTSTDLMNWDVPRVVAKAPSGSSYKYPTIISPEWGDSQSGKSALLVYSYFPDKNHWRRDYRAQVIEFT